MQEGGGESDVCQWGKMGQEKLTNEKSFLSLNTKQISHFWAGFEPFAFLLRSIRGRKLTAVIVAHVKLFFCEVATLNPNSGEISLYKFRC